MELISAEQPFDPAPAFKAAIPDLLAIRETSQSERLAPRVMPVSRCSDGRDTGGVGEKGKTRLLSGELRALHSSRL